MFNKVDHWSLFYYKWLIYGCLIWSWRQDLCVVLSDFIWAIFENHVFIDMIRLFRFEVRIYRSRAFVNYSRSFRFCKMNNTLSINWFFGKFRPSIKFRQLGVSRANWICDGIGRVHYFRVISGLFWFTGLCCRLWHKHFNFFAIFGASLSRYIWV